MRARKSLIFGAIAAGASVLLAGCSSTAATESTEAAADDNVIRFATLPLNEDPSVETPVDVLKELLEEETGMTVEIVDVPNYSAVIESIRAGHEDIGFMSGFPSAMAVNTGEVDALVAWPGLAEPVSTCLVLADSPLQSLSDITPETVIAFADPASSSGYFMPVHMLHEAGLTMDEDYQVQFAGGHDRSLLALKQGDVDVACTSTIFPKLAGKDDPLFPFDEGETRSIGESIEMPVSASFLGSQSMSPEKREALLKAIPAVFSDENREKLGAFMEAVPEGVEPIIEPGKELFQPFVDIAAIADVDISDLG